MASAVGALWTIAGTAVVGPLAVRGYRKATESGVSAVEVSRDVRRQATVAYGTVGMLLLHTDPFCRHSSRSSWRWPSR